MFALSACTDPEIKRQEAANKEAACKTMAMVEASKMESILRLAVATNRKKEHEKAFAAFSDTSLTCEQAKKVWEDYTRKLVLSQ